MRWQELSVSQKINCIVGVLCSIAAIVLSVLAMTGRLENGINYALLSLAAVILSSVFRNWKEQKGFAVFSLVVAVFIFASQLYIFLAL